MLHPARTGRRRLRDHPAHLLAAISAAMVLFALATASPSPAPAAPAPGTAAAVPPQGVYDQCAPTPDLGTCIEHVRRVASNGMPIILNYTSWYATPTDLVAYADAAALAGVKLIWPLNDKVWREQGNLFKRYPKLAAQCYCNDMLAYVVNRLKDHPATWGWYIGDELTVNEAPLVQALADRVRALDPDHPTIYVGMGMLEQLGANLGPYIRAADYIGSDMYPIGSVVPHTLTGEAMAASARQIKPAGRNMVAVLQAFAHNQYPQDGMPDDHFPTAAEMTDQRNQAILASDPSLILWYSLNDVDRSADPAGNWANLVQAANAPPPVVPEPPVATAPRPSATPAAKARARTVAETTRTRGPSVRRRARWPRRRGRAGPSGRRRARTPSGRPRAGGPSAEPAPGRRAPSRRSGERGPWSGRCPAASTTGSSRGARPSA
ncbi:glycoside hydrolase 5 family protein [Capillimicrobium parvum]|uniref:Glycoside hydrolase family 42 N-terminal domain-containing protein n=1 Tax=Capillimicrobium parvum TaxID=2884022 RepID=A0A9E7C6G7_9ACTN|nr:hypothetical protein [Capillimicrobium parvum]UGS38832.1 hypothetical protein DSM104329_05262 [Capillimicrobium parvum]